MLKPSFNYGFNVKTNICIKTTQCENTINNPLLFYAKLLQFFFLFFFYIEIYTKGTGVRTHKYSLIVLS